MRLFFTLLFINWFAFAFSQTVQIIDHETHKPIPSVTLLSNTPKAFAVSDAKGKIDISPFKGAKKIEIRSLGYITLVRSYDEINKEPFEISLESSSLTLDEVVISSSKWKQKSGNIPSKVVRIDSKEVQIQNPQTAADLLGISGNVFIQKSQQGGGSPMIRGFATNRLLYSIDGVRMNTAIFRGGNIQNVISLDPFATESTEVLFGPGSVIYGSDAIGGVMSFTTRSPIFSKTEEAIFKGKAISRFSSANDEKTVHLDLSIGGKKWALLSSISSNNFGHLKQGRNGPNDYLKPFFVVEENGSDKIISQQKTLLQIPTAYNQINVMQKLSFKPSEVLSLQYAFHYSETSSYGRYDRHNRTINNLPQYGRWDYGPQKWLMNNLSLHYSKASPLYDKFTLRFAHQFFEESRINRGFNSLSEKNQKEKLTALSFNVDFSKTLNDKTALFYGLESVYNDIRSDAFLRSLNNNSTIADGARYPESEWKTYAAYIKTQWQVNEKISVHVGVRYAQFDIDARFDTSFYDFSFVNARINNSALTGSLGMTFRPDKNWVLKANASTGFRAPNIDDMGKVFDSEPGAVTVPNPSLDAEFAYNLDWGIARVFGHVLKLDLTAYYTRLENAMVRRNFSINGQDSILFEGVLSQVQAIQNAAFAEVYGLQAGIEFKLSPRFSFSSDLNYQQGKEELDNGQRSNSRHIAPFFGKVQLEFKTKLMKIQAYANYQGQITHEDLAVSEQTKTEIYAKDKNGNTYAPSWQTINLKTVFTLSQKITTSFGIENVTDQRYRPYSSGISGAGRNLILSMYANF